MAAYNRWQNKNLYGTATKLTDEQRKRQRGAFFGSIAGTLSHLPGRPNLDELRRHACRRREFLTAAVER
jgi:hypothetical protein